MNFSRLGRMVVVAGRVAVRYAGRSRTLAAIVSAGHATARSFGGVLHQLWLEVTGFVFLALAGIGGLAGAREYARFEAGKVGFARVALAICFCLTFAYFGLSSFWRVRRKS